VKDFQTDYGPSIHMAFVGSVSCIKTLVEPDPIADSMPEFPEAIVTSADSMFEYGELVDVSPSQDWRRRVDCPTEQGLSWGFLARSPW
jgi:hypothetical protein